MRSILAFTLALFILSLEAGRASADPIRLDLVQTFAIVGPHEFHPDIVPRQQIGTTDASVRQTAEGAFASATLHTDISRTNHLFGNGTFAVEPGNLEGGIAASAQFSVIWEMSDSHRFHLGLHSEQMEDIFFTMDVAASNGDGFDPIFTPGIIVKNGSGTLARNGRLRAGRYFLNLGGTLSTVDSRPAHTGTFNFRFDLLDGAPVPEPASILLFGCGLAALGLKTHRFKDEWRNTHPSRGDIGRNAPGLSPDVT